MGYPVDAANGAGSLFSGSVWRLPRHGQFDDD
jgi:hypothetical protein